MDANPLHSLRGYSRYLAKLLDQPAIQTSTVTAWSDSQYTGSRDRRDKQRTRVLSESLFDMDESQHQLEAKGWRVGSVEELLELTPEEASYIELKLALSESLRLYGKQRQLTQLDLAKLLKSSQSRVAKMEAGDPSVSLDLLVRSLLAMGASREALAQMIATSKPGESNSSAESTKAPQGLKSDVSSG